MTDTDSRAGGFTLIELLIAIAVTGILLGVVMPFFSTNYKSFRVQEQVAEAQQNARAALQIISRDLAMAGYSTAVGTGITFANHTSLTIKNAASTIIYKRYSGNSIGRKVNSGSRQAVAGHIRRLAFSYYSSAATKNSIPFVNGSVSASLVKQVTVTVTAVTPVFGRYSASCTLTTTVAPRNL